MDEGENVEKAEENGKSACPLRLQLIAKCLGRDLHARTISYTSSWLTSTINQRSVLPQRPRHNACNSRPLLAEDEEKTWQRYRYGVTSTSNHKETTFLQTRAHVSCNLIRVLGFYSLLFASLITKADKTICILAGESLR